MEFEEILFQAKMDDVQAVEQIIEMLKCIRYFRKLE